jgi:beta-lactam-binding protein with PASTA domain
VACAAGNGDLATIDAYGGVPSVINTRPPVDTGIAVSAGTSPAITIGGFGRPVVATVPNVTGMDQATAQDFLAVAGLSLGPITWDTHCLDVAGAVLGQDPQAAGSFPGATFRPARRPT